MHAVLKKEFIAHMSLSKRVVGPCCVASIARKIRYIAFIPFALLLHCSTSMFAEAGALTTLY